MHVQQTSLIHKLQKVRGLFTGCMYSAACSLIPPLAWCGASLNSPVQPAVLCKCTATWDSYIHTPKSSTLPRPPTPYPSLPPALAFSSKDKGSWRLACRDLIAKAHFTFPKPGFIHISAPADRNLPLSPLFPCLCFLFLLILKRKKKLDKKWAVGAEEAGERKRFFLLPLHFFLFKSLTMYFAQYCAKTFPCFWRFLALGLTPHSSANIFYSNTTKETKSLRNDRCKNNFILNLLTRIFKHPLIKASLIQPILCLFMNSEGWPVYLCMPNQWDRQAHFDFSNFPTLLRISGMSQQVSRKRKLQLKRARGRSGRNNYCSVLRMTGLPLFAPPAFTSKHST